MSTSRLQMETSVQLSKYLGQYTIRENHRPPWLDGLELDFYIEELRVAIEVQGDQHFRYVPCFHQDYDGFLEQKERDARKRDLCLSFDIPIIYVLCEDDVFEAIADLGCKTYIHPIHPNAAQQLIEKETVRKAASKRKKKRRGRIHFIESRRVRKKGRKRSVKEFSDNLFLVSGGEDQHVVWFQSYDEPDKHVCDCDGWYGAKNQICSHVFAVALYLEIR